jgi:hypothetical protein
LTTSEFAHCAVHDLLDGKDLGNAARDLPSKGEPGAEISFEVQVEDSFHANGPAHHDRVLLFKFLTEPGPHDPVRRARVTSLIEDPYPL